MKILKHFLLSLTLITTGTAQLDAMKRAKPDFDTDADEIQDSKRHKAEITQEQQDIAAIHHDLVFGPKDLKFYQIIGESGN